MKTLEFPLFQNLAPRRILHPNRPANGADPLSLFMKRSFFLSHRALAMRANHGRSFIFKTEVILDVAYLVDPADYLHGKIFLRFGKGSAADKNNPLERHCPYLSAS
jgi:hypothetical protein